jgi:nucleolar protein 58
MRTTYARSLQVVSLKAFKKFDNTADALAAAAALVDSKMPKSLKKFLTKHAVDETVALADAKLGGIVKEKLNIPCVHSASVSGRRAISTSSPRLTNVSSPK